MASGIAVVIGASGGIGAAIFEQLKLSGSFEEVFGLGRATAPQLDLLDEGSIEAAAAWLKSHNSELRLLFDASGVLSLEGSRPEKSWRELTPEAMIQSYAVNAIGPALLMKHFLPLLPKNGKSVFATLSARVGSISDNRAGGWYAYRASKAALNQLVRTAAIELARKRPEAVCVALHPGTVRTPLTDGFAKTGLEVQEPEVAAKRLLAVLDALTPEQSGQFFDYKGMSVPW